MDSRRFDTLSRTLATTGTRRGALAALLAGSVGLLGLSQPAQGRKRRRGGGGGVTIQGPCGDGSGPDNTCERPSDCCTGICERSAPGKPKRCRCRRQDQPCTEPRNCCQGAGQALVCDEGTCRSRCAAVTCTPLDECHEAGVCDPATGTCSDPKKMDGAECNFTRDGFPAIGQCVNGGCLCKPPGGPCISGDFPRARGCCSGNCDCGPGGCGCQ
jgi:hypothetical protein